MSILVYQAIFACFCVFCSSAAHALDSQHKALLFWLNAARHEQGLEAMDIEPIHQWHGIQRLFAAGDWGDNRPNVTDARKPYWNGGWHYQQKRFLNVTEFCRLFIRIPARAQYGDSICQAMMLVVPNLKPGDDIRQWAKKVIRGALSNPAGCFYARLMDGRCVKRTANGRHIIDGRQFRRIAFWLYDAGNGKTAVHFRLLPRKL